MSPNFIQVGWPIILEVFRQSTERFLIDGVPRRRTVDAIFPSGPIGVIWIVYNPSTVKETDFGELPVWKYDASRGNFKLASKHSDLLLHSQASQSLKHAAADENPPPIPSKT